MAKHGGHAKWLCQCECGNMIIVASNSLKTGNTCSCGCYQVECALQQVERLKKHGLSGERLYSVWNNIVSRCTNPKDKRYIDYGGRGISVCDEWKNNYLNFRKWATENGYDETAKHNQCTIDRIDNNGNYEPSNCRWVNQKEQQNNKRSNHIMTYNGERGTVTYFAKKTGIKKQTILSRLARGWNDEKALTTPPRKKKNA